MSSTSAISLSRKRGEPEYSVVSAIPGRVRVRLSGAQRSRGKIDRWAKWLGSFDAFDSIVALPDASSLLLRFNPKSHALPVVLNHVSVAAEHTAAGKIPPYKPRVLTGIVHPPAKSNGANAVFEVEPVSAKEMGETSTGSLGKMVLPTIAAALAVIEFVPVALTVTVIALGAAPTARRVFRDLRSRQFTVDELDLLNVLLATVDGALVPAASISWLINLGATLRERSMTRSRAKHAHSKDIACSKCGFDKTEKTSVMLENALLTDTQFHGVSRRAEAALTTPFFGLAGVIALFTQDIGFIVGILKPLYDFAGALRFGMPSVLLNAMAHAAHHGPIFRSGRAVEKLAKMDAIIFVTADVFKSKKVRDKRFRQLIKRGVHHFVVPSAAQVKEINSIAASLGEKFVMADVLPENPELAVEVLVRHGHTVGIVEDGTLNAVWMQRADIRIGLPGSEQSGDKIDIVMNQPDLRGMAHTIDLARHAMQLARQNIAVSTVASTINLGLALVPPLAATTISTMATGILVSNISRELTYDNEDANEAEVTITESEKPNGEAVETVGTTDRK